MQGDTGVVNEAAIWYMRGTWKWSLANYKERSEQNAVSRDEVLIYIWGEVYSTSVTLRNEGIMKEMEICVYTKSTEELINRLGHLIWIEWHMKDQGA